MNLLNSKYSVSKATGRKHKNLFYDILMPTSLELLKSFPIGKGSKILDLGCSTGQTSFLLLKYICSEGEVIGVDKNQMNLEIATKQRSVDHISKINFSHFADPVWKTKNYYDIIYSRLLFNQLRHPNKVLEMIFKYLVPGGIFIIEEMDFTNHYCFPNCYAFDRYFELIIELKKRKLQDAQIGSKVASIMKNIGFQNIQAQVVSPSFLKSKNKTIVSLSLENISESLLKEKLISPSELQALLFEIKDFESRSDTLITLPSIYQIWGYKH